VHNINTIIFDLGRVLVDIRTDGEKFVALMREAGISAAASFENFWYRREVRHHMTGVIDSKEFYRQAVENFSLSHDYDAFVEAWCDLFHPVPEMEALFGEVAARYRVGLLSDTDPLHWARLRGMLPWLEKIATPTLSYDVGYLKPHPKMFAEAAANCGRAKEECLLIDDRIENVDGARYCGMPALQFTSAEKLRRDLAGFQLL
jgi:putative hydrolase of the HAD superfamily